jgi:arsenate reductase
MVSVQIFGVKNSQETRSAERFFKERRAQIHFVDLTRKALAPAEIKRFTDRFGLAALIDTDSKSWVDSGLKYLKMSDNQLIDKVERDPKLLRLPLVRSGKLVSFGKDEEAWKAMLG